MEDTLTFVWRLLAGLSLVFLNLRVMALSERIHELEEAAE